MIYMADWVVDNNICYSLNTIISIEYIGINNSWDFPYSYKIIFINNKEYYRNFKYNPSFNKIIFNLKQIRELDGDTISLDEFFNYLGQP